MRTIKQLANIASSIKQDSTGIIFYGQGKNSNRMVRAIEMPLGLFMLSAHQKINKKWETVFFWPDEEDKKQTYIDFLSGKYGNKRKTKRK